MSPNTPYRFVEIWVPKGRRGRYTNEKWGWANVVGDLLIPLKGAIAGACAFIRPEEFLCFWLQEGHFFQVNWSVPDWWTEDTSRAPDYVALRKVCKRKGFRIKRVLRGGTLGGGLNGERWNPKTDIGTPKSRARSMLLIRTMDTICSLYAMSLIPLAKTPKSRTIHHWEVEAPVDTKQNPHGSSMESLCHLVANTTEARFDVYVSARTGWMNPSNGLNATYTCKAKIEGLHL